MYSRSNGRTAAIIPIGISWAATEPLLAKPESVSWHYPASGTAPSPPTQFSGAIILGKLTAASNVPKAGSKTYRFAAEGVGTAQFTVDFGSGAIAGQFAASYNDAWGPYDPTPTTLTQPVLSPDRSSFTASYTISGTNQQGMLKGWFFGPNAQYVGLQWKGPVVEPYGPSVIEIFGAWRLEQAGG